MHELSGEERLLRYYAEEHIISGLRRGAIHHHLLRLGYIEEKPVNVQDLLIVVTEAGQAALSSSP